MNYTPEEVAKLLANRPNQPHYIAALIAECVATARADALEQAAQACIALTRTYWNDTSDEDRDYPDADECAAAIRALSAP